MAVSSVLLQATLCPPPQGTLLFHKPAAVPLAYHLNRRENKILPPHIFCFVFVQGYEIVRILMWSLVCPVYTWSFFCPECWENSLPSQHMFAGRRSAPTTMEGMRLGHVCDPLDVCSQLLSGRQLPRKAHSSVASLFPTMEFLIWDACHCGFWGA